MQDHTINKDELNKFGSTTTLSDQVKALLLHQKKNWSLVKTNYADLEKVKVRLLHFSDFKLRLQFNPERIRSSAAKTDENSINERPCFLCEKNRPVEQKGIDFNGEYNIRINPYPIFPIHLTITLNEHQPQRISGRFGDMLRLSKALNEFTVFYNGPKCGASAPDHFHFQAGLKGLMPLYSETTKIAEKYGEVLFNDETLKLIAVDEPYLRKFFLLESNNQTEIERQFDKIHNILPVRDDETEPMMNILCFYNNGWKVVIFPREKQRPKQFFAEGDDQFLMSPASAEMGGLAVLPRENDFERITHADLVSIYRQVSLNNKTFESLKNKLKRNDE